MEFIHENQTHHKCLICEYSFSQKGELNIHVGSVHGNQKPHKCLVCDKSFSLKGQLKIKSGEKKRDTFSAP